MPGTTLALVASGGKGRLKCPTWVLASDSFPAVSTWTGWASGWSEWRIFLLLTKLVEAPPSITMSCGRAVVYNALSLFTGNECERLLQQQP